jgi:hypothetical protein
MQTAFVPPRRRGVLFHAAASLLLIAASLASLNAATSLRISPAFIAWLLAFIGFALPVPVLTYQLYALLRARYELAPGSLTLTWGLRVEKISMLDINWVRPEEQLDFRLPRPLVRFPGAVTGTRRLDRQSRVEFLGSRGDRFILIETPRRAYAITPEDPAAFLAAFQRMSEQASLAPETSASTNPARTLAAAWQSPPARSLIFAGVVLAAAFLGWVTWGFAPQPGRTFPLPNTARLVTSAQIYLLPILNALFTLADTALGLFFHRREETRPLAFLLWATAIISSAFLFTAVILLARGV